jgi:hypothetical protein
MSHVPDMVRVHIGALARPEAHPGATCQAYTRDSGASTGANYATRLVVRYPVPHWRRPVHDGRGSYLGKVSRLLILGGITL